MSLLLELFGMTNEGDEELLRAEQEALVDEFYQKIMSMHKGGKEPPEEDVKACLRDLLRASESAEGEEEGDVEQEVGDEEMEED